MKKKQLKNVRLGVIGIGGMGGGHARSIQEGKIPGAQLTAVSDISEEHLAKWDNVSKFTDAAKMIRSGEIDAVIIGTPHFSHAPLSIAALKGGVHVLVEKPITVRKADAEKIVAAHKKTDRVFAIMFNQRTDPLYIQIKQWINDGTLGKIQRIQWTITDWFRPQSYYVAGSWRGTWAGEGGGILMNQAPHQLDLWQWLFGMPKRVRAVGGTKHHKIEVEDDVTAIFEYANGATGVFVSTTGEAPGLNRLEIAADNGLLIVDGRTVRFLKNEVPASVFSKTTEDKFAKPPFKEETFSFPDSGPQHAGIIANFVETILNKKNPLIAPGAEGVASLELANSTVLSLFTDKPVDLPMKADKFTKLLDSLIKKNKKSAAKKKKKSKR